MYEIYCEEEEGVVDEILIQMDMIGETGFKGVYVLVEGRDDNSFFSRLIENDDSRCEILIVNGRKYIEETIPEADEYQMRIVGIIDRDFDFFIEKEYGSNLIISDTHDLETMILSSPSFQNLVNAYADLNDVELFERQSGRKIIDIILEAATVIGNLRFYDFMERQKNPDRDGMNFQKLDYSRFTNADLKIDLKQLIVAVQGNTNSQFVKSLKMEKIEKDISKYHYCLRYPWQLCNGHDLTELLAFGMQNIFGINRLNKKYERHTIENKLKDKTIFLPDYFRNTPRMYASFLDWEKNHRPYKILSAEMR